MMTWADIFGEKASKLHLPVDKLFSERSADDIRSIAKSLLAYADEQKDSEKISSMKKIADASMNYVCKYGDLSMSLYLDCGDRVEVKAYKIKKLINCKGQIVLCIEAY